ncbi:hypothetical protein G8S49_11360 [Clostridium botulinum C]|uniref:FtsK domain-containing protein n=2 Tax=Clostridium botulinum TaxID=1491 RepID=A0A9Q4XU99_CLOBO|nr:FtsK/SpoIIIE domain-containing protein [Clostridium botulinum]MCD3195751.1 hypothetical protein [Clostridium botulinum C]MCD3201167.1 hypothetical protein [Clostridium botulinum C]MCD3206663.1 hypothetical protein [Clostridium botulinum C]MCD3209338.1 hypothetical protein [Clostridium botulinum C]MCD3226470.1 hypothetical protein [Clostridium botulinum C]
MITEFATAGLIMYAWDKYKNRDIIKIKKEFNKLMEENKLQYIISSIEKTEIGYKFFIDIKGLGIDKLKKTKDILESYYNAVITIKQSTTNKSIAILDIITTVLNDNYKFEPIFVKPYELYLGKTYTMQDVIVSMKDLPHLLYSGINSSGKTYCLLTALTNLIHYYDNNSIEIFLSQISDKKDLRKFKNCTQCRGYAPTLEESYRMFEYLHNVMQKRISMFNSIKNKFIDTIFEWNETFPKKKMRFIYLAMDEFTAYMPDNLDSKEEKELKEKCLDLLIKLIQQCRCTGIYILTSLQRPDKESLPPRLKAQFNCRVSFKQTNIASSLVVCDSDKAFYLNPHREAIVIADDEYLIKTLYLDNDMIKNFIKDKIDLSHSNYFNKNLEKNNIKNTSEESIPPKIKTKSKIKLPCI